MPSWLDQARRPIYREAVLRVRLVGGLALELDGEAVSLPERRAARSLLAWLALNPGEHSRSKVAALFWPDVLDESARASLRVALSSIRRELGTNADRYVVTTRESVGLAPPPAVSIDLQELEALAAAGRLSDAVALGDGELLSGIDYDWAYDARDDHRARLGALMAELAEAAEARADSAEAVEWTRRQLAVDPLSEECARDLMRRMAERGDRAGAVRVHARLRDRLRTELGLVPSRETRDLVAGIAGETAGVEDVAPATVPRRARPAEPSPLPAPLATVDERLFVGRVEYWRRLAAQLTSRTGEGWELAVVSGEPGIGKTRLVARAAGDAVGRGATVLFGRCYEEALTSFQPFVEALDRYLRPVRGASDEASPVPRRDLETVLARVAGTTGGGSKGASDPEADRYRLFEAVSSAFDDARRDGPVLFVLDDLHWADEDTLLMLKHLLRSSAPGEAGLVVGTYRDTEIHEGDPLSLALEDLAAERRVELLHLEGLEERAVAEIVSAWTGGDIALADAIGRETAGNPFFIDELLRHLAESGVAFDEEGRWSSQHALLDLGVPESVKQVIERRVKRLSDDAQRLLRIAAVVGSEFEFELLEAISDLSGDPLLDPFDEMLAARLIEDDPSSGRYVFTHAMIREVLYASLATPRRRHIHERVGAAIETQHGADLSVRLPELARHFHAAARPGHCRKAVQYGRLAGRHAREQLALEDAARHFEQALEALELDTAADEILRTELLLELGIVREILLHLEKSRAAFRGAAESARRARAPEQLARAAIGYRGPAASGTGEVDPIAIALLEEALEALPQIDTPVRAEVLVTLAVALKFTGAPERVEALAREGIAMARRIGDSAVRARVLDPGTWAIWSPDTLDERIELSQEGIRVAREVGDARTLSQHYSWAVSHHLEAGDAEAAARAIEAHAASGAGSGYVAVDHTVTQFRTAQMLLSGPLDRAEELAHQALALAPRAVAAEAAQIFGGQIILLRREQDRAAEIVGLVEELVRQYPALPVWRCALAWLAADIDPDAARAHLDRVMADGVDAVPRDQFWLMAMSVLADASGDLDASDVAEEVYPLLAPYAERCAVAGGIGLTLGSVERPLGELAGTLGRVSESNAHFERALEANRRIGSAPWVARTLYEYARMLLRSGDRPAAQRAIKLAEEAATIADQQNMPAVARKAGSLLARV